MATVRATRAASEQELFDLAAERAQRLMAEGVTTLEIKSGYGLDTETELKMLRVARRIGEALDVQVVTTLLAAHAIPPEYAGRSDDYIDLICREILPLAAKENLCDAVDAFCETIAFSREQTIRVFDSAHKLGLPIKVHAEQLSRQGIAVEAARRGALSVDHLEYLSEADCEELGRSSTVANLLPGAFYCLRESQLPPVDALRRNGVRMGVATDWNPGSSPLASLLLAGNLACNLFGLTPEEAIRGMTLHAAHALGLQDSRGSLEPGKDAVFATFRASTPASLLYTIGGNPNTERYLL
jgi:imidazolonepropionase